MKAIKPTRYGLPRPGCEETVTVIPVPPWTLPDGRPCARNASVVVDGKKLCAQHGRQRTLMRDLENIS